MLIWCVYTYVMMTEASRAAKEFQTLWQRTSQLATLCCVCNRRKECVMREQGEVGHEGAGRSGS